MHIGFLCPPVAGHLNPTLALARSLRAIGHRCTFISVEDARDSVEHEMFALHPVGRESNPPGTLKAALSQLAQMSGMEALTYTSELSRRAIAMLCEELPAALDGMALDGLVIDQASLGCESVAQWKGLPYVTLCNSLLQNAEVGVPPWVTPWDYDPSPLGAARNLAGYAAGFALGLPILGLINVYRSRWGLLPYLGFDQLYSPLAQVCQLVEPFDFPRRGLPAHFHYVGPMRRNVTDALEVEFPWEKLDGRPLVYASLGTLQNAQHRIFYTIAQVCEPLDVQLVLSLGGGLEPEELGKLPGSPVVVQFAPQLELLSKAALCITHSGLNTVLESLSQGVPLVAVPITNDQPAVAARIRRSGVGRTVSLDSFNRLSLSTALNEVLADTSYREKAKQMQQAIESSGGAVRAAKVIEAAILTRQPVEAMGKRFYSSPFLSVHHPI